MKRSPGWKSSRRSSSYEKKVFRNVLKVQLTFAILGLAGADIEKGKVSLFGGRTWMGVAAEDDVNVV